MPQVMLLVGDGVPEETVESIARRLNVGMGSAAPRPAAPAGTSIVTIASGERIVDAINEGAVFGLEPGLAPTWPERLRDFVAEPDGAVFAWCFTAATGYGTPIVDAMTQHLIAIGMLAEEAMWGFRLAMTEAIANACIHGNLEIAGEDRLDPERFVHFVTLVDDRLADPDFARRGLMLSARRVAEGMRAEVWQEAGEMPVPPPIPTRLEENQKAAGRGFALMSAAALRIEISPDRRGVALVFGS